MQGDKGQAFWVKGLLGLGYGMGYVFHAILF
jgi:hypothetical protein